MGHETLQQIYELHYSAESTQLMRAANLLADLRAWCNVNSYYIDQVILEAATSISFPLGTSRTTPSIMWMVEDVVFPDEPISAPPGIQRRAAVADSILDSYEQERWLALGKVLTCLLSSFQHRPTEFYDCADTADRIYKKLIEAD